MDRHPAIDDPDLDLERVTYAEEIALAQKYEKVLWDNGNRRENLQRLVVLDGLSLIRGSVTEVRVAGKSLPPNQEPKEIKSEEGFSLFEGGTRMLNVLTRPTWDRPVRLVVEMKINDEMQLVLVKEAVPHLAEYR